MSIRLIVGLGNPGAQYAQTRHNAGEWFVRALAEQCKVRLSTENKYHGDIGATVIAGEKLHFLVPNTYMNRSGLAVAAVANFYKLAPQEILVAHDELDLPPGAMKLKIGGGHGGHNGLRDIVPALGNSTDFYRLRIGIGHPGAKELVTGWVLGKAPQEEQQKMDAAIREARRYLDELVQMDLSKVQQALHNIKF